MSTAALSYEELVSQVRLAWAEVLGNDTADDVPIDVNFLEAGGNSLLLVMLWEQLRPLATRPVKLSELFQHGTVQAQAALLGQVPESAAATEPERASLLSRRRGALS